MEPHLLHQPIGDTPISPHDVEITALAHCLDGDKLGGKGRTRGGLGGLIIRKLEIMHD